MDTRLFCPEATQAWHDSKYTLYELSNSSGMKVILSDLGATLVSIFTPNREGQLGDVLLGYDQPEQYRESCGYFGASVGRVANRIEDGRFELDGVNYQLPINSGDHCHHGGPEGFHRAHWTVEKQSKQCVIMSLLSADGENGFPGEVRVTACFELSEENELSIVYEAETSQATPINLTSHGYFNLSDTEQQILDHEVTIAADSFLAVDKRLIPNYQVPVADSAFDFTLARTVRSQIRCYDKQLFACGGFDHNYCLNSSRIEDLAATAYSPESGRMMELYTNLPGIQFYTGNHLSGEPGKGGKPMAIHAGLCLEPQFPPNMINSETPEACIVRPGAPFRAEMKFRFSVK